MKKVTLMLALAATLFAACDKDDDHNTPAEPVQQVPATVSMTYHLDATDDMLQSLDYTVIYIDGTGEHEETLPARALHLGVRAEHGAHVAPADEAERGLREAGAVGIRGEDVGTPLAAEDADLVAVRRSGDRQGDRAL